jgi:hypothetical protein
MGIIFLTSKISNYAVHILFYFSARGFASCNACMSAHSARKALQYTLV